MDVKKLLTILILPLLTIACSADSQTSAQQANSAETVSSTVDIESAEDRFNFAAPELESNRLVEGAELFSQRPLIITFVVPDCPICVEEGPLLATAAENNSEVTYVFIHSQADAQSYDTYVQNSRLVGENVVHLQDDEAVLWELFGVTQQPSTVLVSESGQTTVSVGALGEDGLAQAAALVLGDS